MNDIKVGNKVLVLNNYHNSNLRGKVGIVQMCVPCLNPDFSEITVSIRPAGTLERMYAMYLRPASIPEYEIICQGGEFTDYNGFMLNNRVEVIGGSLKGVYWIHQEI